MVRHGQEPVLIPQSREKDCRDTTRTKFSFQFG